MTLTLSSPVVFVRGSSESRVGVQAAGHTVAAVHLEFPVLVSCTLEDALFWELWDRMATENGERKRCGWGEAGVAG